MAQLNSTFIASPQQTAQAKVSQARLILQDPLAFEQAIQPSLRSSNEMSSDAVPVMERESARELWENLSAEPTQAQQQRSEHKRLSARAESAVRESAAAKAELVALQTQIAQERDNRWHHPVIYAGATGLLGLGALWVLERRRRMQLQSHEPQAWAQPQSPILSKDANPERDVSDDLAKYIPPDGQQGDRAGYVVRNNAPADMMDQVTVSEYALEDSPYFADDYATDLSGLPSSEHSVKGQGTQETKTVSSHLGAEHLQNAVAPQAPPVWAIPRTEVGLFEPKSTQDVDSELPLSQESLLAKSQRVLRNMLQRKLPRDAAPSSHAPTEMTSDAALLGMPSTLSQPEQVPENVQWMPDDEAREAFEQEQLARHLQSQLRDGLMSKVDQIQARTELPTQPPLKPPSRETAIELLLELRTAVNGLSVLGRPEGALVLLTDHIEAHPDTCAWAYLEHMNLCERLDLRTEFESMRKRYRLQFNRMAPYWHEPNSNVLGLDGYARAASELCGTWVQGRSPSIAMISAWLIGPILGRKLVQLPAYQDLFDLYELLEFTPEGLAASSADAAHTVDPSQARARAAEQFASGSDEDFVPTVSLLDLDYEFSSDVTLEEREVQQAERAVTIVKPGNFSVDFNVAGTQVGSLPSIPAELSKQ